MEILKVENLCKTYGKGETLVKALDNVSFSVEKGEFVAIVGSSGSGKSTLLHILGGVDRPTSGKVYVDDEDVYKLNETNLAIFRRRQVGLIYQFYNLIPILNVKENMTLPILLDSKKVDEKYLDELIEILGLTNRVNHLPNELSGGQQQRVSIGRALMNRPTLLLADEPTGALDSTTSVQIMELIKEIAKDKLVIMVTHNKEYKQTIIMITHDHDLALNASRIITLEDGKIISDERIK